MTAGGTANVIVVAATGAYLSSANIGGTGNIVGNANVGNLGTPGLIIATGNVTGANLVATLYAYTGVNTVANLAAAGTAGRRFFVNNASATTFASIVAGGGANFVPVYDDGTNWRIG